MKTAETVEGVVAPVLTDDQREAALVALYEWHRDWSNTARSVVKKRIHLISLGLAKRKSAKEDDVEEVTAPAPPAPATHA